MVIEDNRGIKETVYFYEIECGTMFENEDEEEKNFYIKTSESSAFDLGRDKSCSFSAYGKVKVLNAKIVIED